MAAHESKRALCFGGGKQRNACEATSSAEQQVERFLWYRIVEGTIVGYKLKIAQLFSKTGVGSVFI